LNFKKIDPKGKEIVNDFTGFKAKFLEYEGSLVTPTKIAEHLNTCLFQTLLKKPEGITTLDSFKR